MRPAYAFVMKDFDNWNTAKKQLEVRNHRKRYHAGDVWWIRLGLNVGFEQDGKHENYERPAVVLRGFSKEVCLIVPLTTRCKEDKFSIFVGEFEGRKNYAILSQIRLIDTKRLVNQVGFVSGQKLYEIKKAIWKLLR